MYCIYNYVTETDHNVYYTSICDGHFILVFIHKMIVPVVTAFKLQISDQWTKAKTYHTGFI